MKILIAFMFFSTLANTKICEEHAIYVSVTNIKLDEESHKAYLSLKVFSNDLEDAIQNHSGKRFQIIGKDDFSDILTILENYIVEYLRIELDSKDVALQVLSAENMGDATWIYMEGPILSQFSEIKVQNTVLMEIFDTQTNVVEVNLGDKKYYLRLSKKVPEETLNLR